MIAVTGAHSEFGQKFLERLLEKRPGAADSRVCALVTPWSKPMRTRDGVDYEAVDLTKDLSAEVKSLLAGADRLFHFAWVRDLPETQAIAANRAMVLRLMEALGAPEKFIFISSVAASPSAKSIYGRAKHAVSALVCEKGGTVVSVGLAVSEPPVSAYKTLLKIVRRTPFSFRTKGETVSVYPVPLESAVSSVLAVMENSLPPGLYRAAAEKTDLNRLLGELEKRWPRRRLTIFFHPSRLLRWLSWGLQLRLLPRGLVEKALTFLHKDDDYLTRQAKAE